MGSFYHSDLDPDGACTQVSDKLFYIFCGCIFINL